MISLRGRKISENNSYEWEMSHFPAEISEDFFFKI
jgi:hypothetical protein